MAASASSNIVCPVCSDFMFIEGAEEAVFLTCSHALHRTCHGLYMSAELREEQKDVRAVNALLLEQRTRVRKMVDEKMPKIDIREEQALLDELEEHALVRRALARCALGLGVLDLGVRRAIRRLRLPAHPRPFVPRRRCPRALPFFPPSASA